MFFVLSRGWDKEKILSPHEESNLRPSDSAFRYFTTEPQRLYGEQGPIGSFSFYVLNMTLSTLLILAVCRTRVIYELGTGPFSPESLCGSVVENSGARIPKCWGSIPHGDFEFFLCTTLVTRRKTSLSFSLPSSKLTIYLIPLTNLVWLL